MTLSIPIVGGAHWLNLVNTEYLSQKQPVDLLQDEHSLAAWLYQSGLSENPATLLTHIEKRDYLRHQLRILRDISKLVIKDLHEHAVVTADTLQRLDAFLHSIPLRVEIKLEAGTIIERYRAAAETDDLLYQIAISIVHTLQNVPADRIRTCEHEECVLYFADTSKAGKRRWCSMESCGNRHKVAAFLKRKSSPTP